MRIFHHRAYFHVTNGKLEARATKVIFFLFLMGRKDIYCVILTLNHIDLSLVDM